MVLDLDTLRFALGLPVDHGHFYRHTRDRSGFPPVTYGGTVAAGDYLTSDANGKALRPSRIRRDHASHRPSGEPAF